MSIRILIACEESDEVRGRFEKLGFDAWSCDIQPNRNINAKHYQCDVFEIINDNWDIMIAFPPCTHLAVSGAAHFEKKRADGRQQDAIDFFMALVNAPIKHIAIENPIGIMSNLYRKPNQVIHPFYFGDEARKSTCLWLKNLPLLYHNASPNLFDDKITHVGQGDFFYWTDGKTGKQKRQPKWYADAFMKTGIDANERSKLRSKTFPGIAEAMAKQWSDYIFNL